MKRRGLRLPLVRRPDPVLTPDEIDFVADRMRAVLASVRIQIARGPVSGTVFEEKRLAESVLPKLEDAGAWIPQPRVPGDHDRVGRDGSGDRDLRHGTGQ